MILENLHFLCTKKKMQIIMNSRENNKLPKCCAIFDTLIRELRLDDSSSTLDTNSTNDIHKNNF